MEPDRSMSLLDGTFVEEVSTALDHHLSDTLSHTTAAASQKSVKNEPKSDIGKCFVGFVNFVQFISILIHYILPESKSYPYKPPFNLLGTSGWLAILVFGLYLV